MREWFLEHFWITYTIIFILVSYVYNKVFRVGKLTIPKALLVYVLIAIGSYMLLIFQALGLPIVLSLAVAVFLMLIVRVRYFLEGRTKRKQDEQSTSENR
jgi:hypothetical protein